MKRRFLALAIATLLAVVVVYPQTALTKSEITTECFNQAKQTIIKNTFRPPSSQSQKWNWTFIAKTTYDKKMWFLYQVTAPSRTTSQADTENYDVVLTNSSSNCLVVFTESGGTGSFRPTPLPAAQQLRLAQYQKILKGKPKAEVQKSINQLAQEGFPLSSEEKWALQQLGYKIPKSIRILPY